MLTKRKKMIMRSCLLSGILLSILGCVGIKNMTHQKQRYPQEAQRSIVVTIDTSRRDEFFDQLRKFADKHNFKVQIDVQPSGPEDFLIYMTREDVEIAGGNYFAPGEYKIFFYHADLRNSAPESVLDDLVNELKSFVSEVPGTTFSVEK